MKPPLAPTATPRLAAIHALSAALVLCHRTAQRAPKRVKVSR